MPPAGKVLIVDDEVAATEIFAHVLRLHGYDVRTAQDAESGLEAALSTRFDAVLLDLVMPVTSGLELLRRFRSAPSGPATPVAIITGNYLVEDETVQELRQLGAIIKFKPLWAEDLIAITRTLIEGEVP
jgi:DNA-binding response OmpR family regulator